MSGQNWLCLYFDPEGPDVVAVTTSADGGGCFRARRRRQRLCPT